MALLLPTYPSRTGNKIATKIGFYTEEENWRTQPEPAIVADMREFEMNSITGTFEDACTAFADRRLTAKQKKHLLELYKSAIPRAHAFSAEALIRTMQGSDTKEIVNAAKTLLTEIVPQGQQKHEESAKWVVNVIQQGTANAD